MFTKAFFLSKITSLAASIACLVNSPIIFLLLFLLFTSSNFYTLGLLTFAIFGKALILSQEIIALTSYLSKTLCYEISKRQRFHGSLKAHERRGRRLNF